MALSRQTVVVVVMVRGYNNHVNLNYSGHAKNVLFFIAFDGRKIVCYVVVVVFILFFFRLLRLALLAALYPVSL